MADYLAVEDEQRLYCALAEITAKRRASLHIGSPLPRQCDKAVRNTFAQTFTANNSAAWAEARLSVPREWRGHVRH